MRRWRDSGRQAIAKEEAVGDRECELRARGVRCCHAPQVLLRADLADSAFGVSDVRGPGVAALDRLLADPQFTGHISEAAPGLIKI